MPKFFSNIVFVFGFLLLGIVSFSLVQRYLETGAVDESSLVPACDLPTLDLGTEAEFHETLDKLYADGGLERVQLWAESQLVPGRTLLVPGHEPADAFTQYALIDRDLRQCDREGLINPDQTPLLERQNEKLNLGSRAVQVKWTRPKLTEPFTLTTWCLPPPTRK